MSLSLSIFLFSLLSLSLSFSCMHTYTHIHAYTYVYTHTHTYIHIHTNSHKVYSDAVLSSTEWTAHVDINLPSWTDSITSTLAGAQLPEEGSDGDAGNGARGSGNGSVSVDGDGSGGSGAGAGAGTVVSLAPAPIPLESWDSLRYWMHGSLGKSYLQCHLYVSLFWYSCLFVCPAPSTFNI